MASSGKRKFKVVIVGTGPAGIFSAVELKRLIPGIEILLVDKGPDLGKRRCPRQEEGGPCRQCRQCAILSGWGGAGAFSDGKLNLTTKVGGSLGGYLSSEKEFEELIGDVDRIYLTHGAPKKIFSAPASEEVRLVRHFGRHHLELLPSRIRHLGTERCQKVLRSMKNALKNGVEFAFSREITRLLVDGGRIYGVQDRKGRKYRTDYVVLAPGRDGAEWLAEETRRLGMNTRHHPVDLGVRVEVPSAVTADLAGMLYEAKVRFRSPSFDDPVRTFCMCPEGEVVMENHSGVTLVNGQSYAGKKTGRTNFAILVSTNFTEPFRQPIAYGKYIGRLANILSGGVVVQRLGDLRAGRRSTADRIARGAIVPSLPSATAGDLSFVLPYRILTGILEMLEALGRGVRKIDAPDTLLYGVEAKFYSLRLHLTPALESEVKNLFIVGDGAGVSRGLVQASASGLIAAREVARREREGTS